MITISAPAKINLTLEILGKRPDGYHEIRSVMQTISLMDTLRFEEADKLEFHSGSENWVAEKSLVARAVELLREKTGVIKGASITIDKHIPLLSGLGGDSSDAAATLLGLNGVWKLGLYYEQLFPLARQLGSDVAFFLDGGTALVTGRGDEVTIIPLMPHHWVVLTMPAIPGMPGKTGLLYKSLTPDHYTDGHFTGKMVEVLESGKEFDSGMMFNVFEKVAFNIYSGLENSHRHIKSAGVSDVLLAGSGPTLFSLFREKKEAENVYSHLIRQGLESYLVETLSMG
jgi:4-diphosphocytidyl-2-C-methyl-D-erythritol kinase